MRRKEIKNMSVSLKKVQESRKMLVEFRCSWRALRFLQFFFFEYINGFSALTRASPYNLSQKEAYHTANMFWNLIGDLCPV